MPFFTENVIAVVFPSFSWFWTHSHFWPQHIFTLATKLPLFSGSPDRSSMANSPENNGSGQSRRRHCSITMSRLREHLAHIPISRSKVVPCSNSMEEMPGFHIISNPSLFIIYNDTFYSFLVVMLFKPEEMTQRELGSLIKKLTPFSSKRQNTSFDVSFSCFGVSAPMAVSSQFVVCHVILNWRQF